MCYCVQGLSEYGIYIFTPVYCSQVNSDELSISGSEWCSAEAVRGKKEILNKSQPDKHIEMWHTMITS